MDGTRSSTRLVVGVMTGTSIDGIDAALVRVIGNGLDIKAALVRHQSQALGALAIPLRNAAEQKSMNAGDFAKLAWQFGHFHAEVIGRLMNSVKSTPDLICVHGQTIFHQPPISCQLINPAPIAAHCGCPVVSDLRQADLAAGGQGAPITPIADWILFRDSRRRRAVVNLGGFCNVTILPSSDILKDIRGFDVCACNQTLDLVAREALGKPFDENGVAASSGRARPHAADALLAILRNQRSSRRSLGTGDEAEQWVRNHIKDVPPADLAASAVDAISRCIGESIRESAVDEVIVAGGGSHNSALLKSIESNAQIPVRISDDVGVPIDAREATCFAVLGTLCADGVPITLPQVTGCREPSPVAGVWSNPTTATSPRAKSPAARSRDRG